MKTLTTPFTATKSMWKLTDFRLALSPLYVNCFSAPQGLSPAHFERPRMMLASQYRTALFRLHSTCALCYIHGEKAKPSASPF